MSFSELLKQCRKKQGVSQAELAAKLGVTQQAVGKWESGKSSPDPSTVARIAELLNTTADYLLGLYRPVSNVSAPEERFFGSYSESLIPVIGTVKAGYGALAFEEDYGQEYARVKDPSNYFYLVVRGDSMEPRIQDGDLALVHKQDTLENGDLGVLIYGDEGEGTLKRYIQRGNCVVLQPFNPAYNELVIKGEDLNHLHIAGRVVETKAKCKSSILKWPPFHSGHIQRKICFLFRVCRGLRATPNTFSRKERANRFSACICFLNQKPFAVLRMAFSFILFFPFGGAFLWNRHSWIN